MRALYFVICDRYNLPIVHYTQTVPAIQENEKAKVFWDHPIQLQALILHNCPDIVVVDKKVNTWYVIEGYISCNKKN